MNIKTKIILSELEVSNLEKIIRSNTIRSGVYKRAKIILLSSEGYKIQEISNTLGVFRHTVRIWKNRYIEQGIDGILKDKPRQGRPKRITTEQENEVIELTTNCKPENMTHWSRSLMSKRTGISESTIGRIWKKHGLKPHLQKTFKVSNDPNFKEKLEDIVGLYLSPPEHAVIFSCDEKSSIQALDRTQPSLPLKKGRCGTMTHDYKRNGTTSLFAALNILDGSVIGECKAKHTHKEWLEFLKSVVKQVPKEKEIHIICDNYATHKHKKVKEWTEKQTNLTFHFTPTSASWLNMVERFFRDITEQQIRRGIFNSTDDLVEKIMAYIETHNKNPKPFVWTKSANDILEKVMRAKKTLGLDM